MAIQWNKLDPNKSLIEAIGLPINEKATLSLKSVLNNYLKTKTGDRHHQTNYTIKKIIAYFDGKKQIKQITVKDMVALFDKTKKSVGESTAYSIRITVFNAIRYVLTGQTPSTKTIHANSVAPSTNGSQAFDTAKLKFSAAKLDTLKLLLPIFGKTGRYAGVKTNVQNMIDTLPEGQGGLIEAPKKFMDDKEAKSIITAVTHLWAKSKMKWSMKWNPQRSVFVLMRQADLDKFRNNN